MGSERRLRSMHATLSLILFAVTVQTGWIIGRDIKHSPVCNVLAEYIPMRCPMATQQITEIPRKRRKATLNRDSRITTRKQMANQTDYLHALLTRQKELNGELKQIAEEIGRVKPEFLDLFNQIYPAEEGASVEGTSGVRVRVAPATERSTIKDLPTIASYLDDVRPGLFFEVAKVSLKVLKDYLTPPELDRVLQRTTDSKDRTITPL